MHGRRSIKSEKEVMGQLVPRSDPDSVYDVLWHLANALLLLSRRTRRGLTQIWFWSAEDAVEICGRHLAMLLTGVGDCGFEDCSESKVSRGGLERNL